MIMLQGTSTGAYVESIILSEIVIGGNIVLLVLQKMMV